MKLINTLKSLVALCALALCLGITSAANAQSPARPDLTVPGIGARNYTTTTIIAGRTVKLYWSKAIVFIYNRGNATSAPCHLRLEHRDWVTGAVLKTFVVSVPAVAPGVYQQVDIIAPQLQTNFTDQSTYMTGFVDCNFEVLESNENNNSGFSGPGGFGS